MGRAAKPPGERTVVLTVRLPEAERDAIRARAEREGLSVNELVRRALTPARNAPSARDTSRTSLAVSRPPADDDSRREVVPRPKGGWRW